MTLNPAWFNGLVDDTGTGTTGTVWNKATISGLTGAIDSEIARLEQFALRSMIGPLPITGINNDYNPSGAASAVVWLLYPSAISYITGIVRPAPGTQRLLINTGTPITLSNLHTGSAAVNRIIGPGGADYSLGTWASIWLYYSDYHANWIALKP